MRVVSIYEVQMRSLLLVVLMLLAPMAKSQDIPTYSDNCFMNYTSATGPQLIPDKSALVQKLVQENPQLKEKYTSLMETEISTRKAELAIRLETMNWVNDISTWIFGVVTFLLALGVGIACWEFGRASKLSMKVEVSATKLAIHANTAGTIILLTSMVMYFLFLKFVLPIRII